MNVSDHNAQLYEELFASDYHQPHRDKVKKILKLINKRPKRVLDIGCGDGWFSEIIKDKYKAEVHGVDLMTNCLKKARAKGIKTKKFDLSGKRWPYKNGSFDLIIAGDVIEHIYDTEHFIKECKRLLKKGGELIITTPNINSYHNRFLVPLGFFPMWIDFAPNLMAYDFSVPSGHVRVFNKTVLKKLVEHYGLKVKKIVGAGFRATKKLTKESKLKAGIGNAVEWFFGNFPSMASLIIIKVVK